MDRSAKDMAMPTAPLGFISLTLTCHLLAVEHIRTKSPTACAAAEEHRREPRKTLCERFLMSRLMEDWLDLMASDTGGPRPPTASRYD